MELGPRQRKMEKQIEKNIENDIETQVSLKGHMGLGFRVEGRYRTRRAENQMENKRSVVFLGGIGQSRGATFDAGTLQASLSQLPTRKYVVVLVVRRPYGTITP